MTAPRKYPRGGRFGGQAARQPPVGDRHLRGVEPTVHRQSEPVGSSWFVMMGRVASLRRRRLVAPTDELGAAWGIKEQVRRL